MKLPCLLLVSFLLTFFSTQTIASEDNSAESYRDRSEACLTLVRKIYSDEEGDISPFIQNHPTRTKGELANKVLSRMIMKCRAEITTDQMAVLLPFKHEPLKLDAEKHNLAVLVQIDLGLLAVDPNSADPTAAVYQTQEESIVSNEVEDLSDDMKREYDDEVRDLMGKTTIAFLDISKMTALHKVLYLIFAVGFFGAIFWGMYKMLFDETEDYVKEHKQKITARKQK